MRHPRACALPLLLLAAACSGPAQGNASETSAAADPGAPTLRGTVGSEQSPDAFEIALVGEDGAPVTTLPAGEYNVQVTDWSAIHNFHINGGNRAVEEKTGVTEKGETTWVVRFEPGEYRYMCDPHPSMNGRFTVS